jgi:hypothetical protein
MLLAVLLIAIFMYGMAASSIIAHWAGTLSLDINSTAIVTLSGISIGGALCCAVILFDYIGG